MRNELAEYGCMDAEFLKLLIAKDVPNQSTKIGMNE